MSKAMDSKSFWWGSLILAATICIAFYYFPQTKGRPVSSKVLFKFFTTKPPSLQLVEYGHDIDIFQKGVYVLTFTITESDLTKFMMMEGYSRTEVTNDPARWPIDRCNMVIRGFVNNARIEPSNDCYYKDTATNKARVFYNAPEKLAIFYGGGRY